MVTFDLQRKQTKQKHLTCSKFRNSSISGHVFFGAVGASQEISAGVVSTIKKVSCSKLEYYIQDVNA